jgi:hypothetical protein
VTDASRALSSQELGTALDALGLEYENPEAGAYLVKLPGQHKLATMTWLMAGQHSLQVEAFFCRQPDENHAEFYRFLLGRNGRMYGVGFALDATGDVYLTGRLPLCTITEAGIDRLLGSVLSYADDTFDQALQLGFGSAIRREWAWRTKTGQSTANLQAFARFAAPPEPLSREVLTLCCYGHKKPKLFAEGGAEGGARGQKVLAWRGRARVQ